MLAAMQGSYQFLLYHRAVLRRRSVLARARRTGSTRSATRCRCRTGCRCSAKIGDAVRGDARVQAVGALASIAIQLGKGYTHLEPGVYLRSAAAAVGAASCLMGGRRVCLQVFTNNKFIGYALLILVLVLQAVLRSAAISTHNLYNFGGWPTRRIRT